MNPTIDPATRLYVTTSPHPTALTLLELAVVRFFRLAFSFGLVAERAVDEEDEDVWGTSCMIRETVGEVTNPICLNLSYRTARKPG
jgi:hypothetical protein